MKREELEIGKRYVIRYHGLLTIVQLKRVDELPGYKPRQGFTPAHRTRTRWVCMRESTGREIQIKSAGKFLRPAVETQISVPVVHKTTGQQATLVVPGAEISRVIDEQSQRACPREPEVVELVNELKQAVKKWNDDPKTVDDPTESLSLGADLYKIVASHLQGMEMERSATT